MTTSGREPDPWQDRALCAQVWPDTFFPDYGLDGPTQRLEAKAICRLCDVRTECLNEAIRTDERFGVLGGLTSRERRALKAKTKAVG